MRILLKAEWPVEAGNAAIKSGNLKENIKSLLEDLKAEAVYFTLSNGKRTTLAIVNIEDASQMPALGEPFFLKFNAHIEMVPVMVPEDLMKAEADFERVIKKYG